MINYYINSTEDYHKNELNSLGWELTVCNALDPMDSPCRRLIASQTSFGENLYRFLEEIIPVDTIRTILEIGGGMGYLMRDLLKSIFFWPISSRCHRRHYPLSTWP